MSDEQKTNPPEMEPHDRKTARKQKRCTRYISKETGITFPSESRKVSLFTINPAY